MSRIRYLLAVVAVGALLAGCGGRVESEGSAVDRDQAVDLDASVLGPPQDPVALIGLWTVAEADGGAGDVLRLGSAPGDGLRLFGRCGAHMGTWRADVNGLFVADLWGTSGPGDGRDCQPGPEPADTWLHHAVAFRVEADGPVLLDDRGGRVARLLAGAKPTPGPDTLASLAEPPEVTDEARRAFAPAAALPAALTLASRKSLLGRWMPVDGRRGGPKAAYVELRADGGWRGSDGCNGQGGRWVAGPGGALLATDGVSTLIGCDNLPVGTWLASARRAGLDGDVLVLLDAQGKETGRLRRDR
ncbi:META domain-containing protein [Micromonospora sp. NPDC093277]|uniref:META domain-containing protein n=1 Tax=Micromonospora sp. NPDC093277 TaxID=3364291 RepID=UPI0037FB4AB9